MSRTLRPILATTALLALFGCDSERVKTFKGHAEKTCACADAACAKAEHQAFVKSWDAMSAETIDWESSEGKKDKKGIEDAVKGYRECLSKHVSPADATAVCQEDDAAKKSTESCTACCNTEGRFFKSWVDPLAAGLAGALGAGNIQGCTCS